ncbi:MAG: xylulokinase [Nostocoides sp.]
MVASAVLAFDVGTSGVKAVVTDADGRPTASAYQTYPLSTLPDGGVEQSLDHIVDAVFATGRQLAASLGDNINHLTGISVTAQMFNLVPVGSDGRASGPMISWLDQRAGDAAANFAQQHPDQWTTFGCVLTAKDIVPRIRWLQQERPSTVSATRWLLDCKEAIVMALCGRAVIDPSGATAFRLTDDTGTNWDPAKCRIAGVSLDLLPTIRPATDVAGGLLPSAADRLNLPVGTPVYVGTGDVIASQLGAGAVHPGDAHLSLGTAAYFGLLLPHRGEDPGRNLAPLVHVDRRSWILWLEMATGGAALTWALRLTGLVGPDGTDFQRMEALVRQARDGMGDLVFGPWFTGERVPLFDDSLRGAVSGLDLHHGPGHLIRSVMLGVACQLRWALTYGEAFATPATRIVAVGGGAMGSLWTQLIANVLGREVVSLDDAQDAGSVGAASCALVGAGLQDSFEFLADRSHVGTIFRPDPDESDGAQQLFHRFQALAGHTGPTPARA